MGVEWVGIQSATNEHPSLKHFPSGTEPIEEVGSGEHSAKVTRGRLIVDFNHLWAMVTSQGRYFLPSSGTNLQKVPSRNFQARHVPGLKIPETPLRAGRNCVSFEERFPRPGFLGPS